MKKILSLVVGIGALSVSPVAHADPILSSVSHTGSASANAVAGQYVYGPYGPPRHQGYGWHIIFVQYANTGAAAPLNGSSGPQAAAGTYYKPTYSGTAQSSNTFSDADTLAVLRVRLQAATTLTTPKLGHQRATASAQATDTFFFTLANDSSVNLDVTGSPGNTVRIVDQANGETVFTANGAGSFHDSLSAGSYAVVAEVADSAGQDTQYNLFTNLGSTTAVLDYTLSVSPSS